MFVAVKAAIIRCNSQVKAATEKYQKTTEELEAKVSNAQQKIVIPLVCKQRKDIFS